MNTRKEDLAHEIPRTGDHMKARIDKAHLIMTKDDPDHARAHTPLTMTGEKELLLAIIIQDTTTGDPRPEMTGEAIIQSF